MRKAGHVPIPAFAKTWSKAFVSLRLTDTVWMQFPQAALECKRCDLRGVEAF